MAKLATGLLIVRSVGDCRPYLFSHCNPPRLTTLSRETECWATHHGRSASANSFDVLGDDVSLLPVSNVGVVELHAVKLGLTKDRMPCHQQRTLKPGTKVIAITNQCKTPAKARVTNVPDENGPRLLLFVL